MPLAMIAALGLSASPLPTPTTGALEMRCSGGIAGGTTMTRLSADGRVDRTRFRSSVIDTSRASPARAAAFLALFDATPARPTPGYRHAPIPDGFNCVARRTGASARVISLPSTSSGDPGLIAIRRVLGQLGTFPSNDAATPQTTPTKP